MLKIPQARLQQYMNWELPNVQAGFRKGRGTRDQIANIRWIIEKAREFQKSNYFCFIDYAKAFDCASKQTVENFERDGNTRPSYLPPEKPVCSQEATVRTGYRTMDWFQIGKGVRQGCILSPCLFIYMQSTSCEMPGWMRPQAGIKIAGRNTSKVRYADDTALMSEREEEIKSLLLKVKEESEKSGLKLNFQKTKIMASGLITSGKIDGETMETVRDFIFLGSKITADGDCSHEIKRRLLLGRTVMTKLDTILTSRDITLLTKVVLVERVIFPIVMHRCESWTIKKAEHWRIGAFELWCWKRLLRIPWTARRSNQSILKKISPEYSLEGLMLNHILWPPDAKNWLIGKDPVLGKTEGRKRRGRQRIR